MSERSRGANITVGDHGQASEREELEAASQVLIARLHRRSNDFEATRELGLVTAKLQRTSYGTPVVTTNS